MFITSISNQNFAGLVPIKKANVRPWKLTLQAQEDVNAINDEIAKLMMEKFKIQDYVKAKTPNCNGQYYFDRSEYLIDSQIEFLKNKIDAIKSKTENRVYL